MRFFTLLLVSATFITMPVMAQPAGNETLPLELVLKNTYLDNPRLKSARSEFKSVVEQLPQALAGYRPTITADASVTQISVDEDPGTEEDNLAKEFGVVLSEPLYRGGRTVASTSQARELIKAQEWDLATTEQSVLLSAVQVYLNVLRDRSLLQLAEKNRETIAKELEATDARFEVGELTKTDTSQARARLSDAEANVTSARGNLKSSEASFREITGMRVEKLAFPTQYPFSIPESLDSAVQNTLAGNTSLKTATHVHQAAKAGIGAISGALLPEVALVGSLGQSYDPGLGTIDEERSAAIGIQAVMPLYEAGSTRSRVRESKYVANQRFYDVLDAERQVRDQIISAWEDYRASQANIVSRRAQVDANRVAREGVLEESRVGERTVLDVLDAERELLDAEVGLVTAQRDAIFAAYQLAAIAGELTPETLGFAELKLDTAKIVNEAEDKWFSTAIEDDVR
ncbi:MAG: TolC family outer membrane protein [Alphaproteobacteria bacterium]|nr:TolC family outer membrane protein [Alphaproteobacteria bacterium]